VKTVEWEEKGWYFYFKDGSCKIGPYSDKEECQQDFNQYTKTGRISKDEKKGRIPSVGIEKKRS
jgi:hypothetical protein